MENSLFGGESDNHRGQKCNGNQEIKEIARHEPYASIFIISHLFTFMVFLSLYRKVQNYFFCGINQVLENVSIYFCSRNSIDVIKEKRNVPRYSNDFSNFLLFLHVRQWKVMWNGKSYNQFLCGYHDFVVGYYDGLWLGETCASNYVLRRKSLKFQNVIKKKKSTKDAGKRHFRFIWCR